jgi:hypothetical protein
VFPELNPSTRRIPMPFIAAKPAAAPVRFCELLEVQDAEDYIKSEERRERNFKIKFGICLVSAVFCGSFLWAIAVF